VPALRKKKSITELAVTRQGILDSFGDNDNQATDLKNMDRLTAIEKRIERAIFETDADKRPGNLILMEDKPSRWDDFQENLFLRMQEFA
jgi:hypothetical protein